GDWSSDVCSSDLMLALTLVYPVMIAYFARLEWGPLFTGYLGLLLMGGAFLAVGLLASSLTENQIVAAFATFVVLLIFWVIGWSADYTGGLAGRVLSHLSLVDHFESFSKGVIDSRDVIYYVDFMVLALFLRVLGVLTFVEAVSYRHNARLDLTENSRNTLAPQTIQLLRTLKSDVVATAFFRADQQTKRVAEDLLKQYGSYSNGRFTWK